MDKPLARPRMWQRFVGYGVVGVLILGAAAWMLLTSSRGNVYRLQMNRVTIATVAEGPFEDYIAVRGTVAPLITDYLTTDQGGTVQQVLVEDGATVKSGQKLIILSNPALQLQVAAQQITFEQTRFKYQHDLLEIEHQVSKLKNDLARDKILLDGNAIAPSTYQQEREDYNYYLKLRAATLESRDIEQRVRATQLTGKTGVHQADIANAAVDALTVRAPMDGQLTALDAEVGQSKPPGAVLGQVNSADRFKLTAQVDEFYLAHLSLGQEGLFTLGNHPFEPRSPSSIPRSSTAPSRWISISTPTRLPASMSARRSISKWSSVVLREPCCWPTGLSIRTPVVTGPSSSHRTVPMPSAATCASAAAIPTMSKWWMGSGPARR